MQQPSDHPGMLVSLPTASDVARVKMELKDKREMREALQPAIQYLSMALGGLANQHVQLSKEIDHASAFIAPIRKLPVETLSCIFEFCMLLDDDAPVSLSSVCRRWRAAASSPRVWSRIVIDLDDAYAMEKATAYLERSRNTLLDVELHRPGFAETGWRAWVKVLAHAHRWRTLEITASTYDLVNDLLEDLPVLAPKLVHATITVEGFFFVDAPGHTEFPRLELAPEFIAYPGFRSLRLQTWALPALTVTESCVLSQLTTLHLTDTFASTFHRADRVRLHPICGNAISVILSLCPVLETFTFDARASVGHHSGKCCQDPIGSGHEPFTLPALRHLILMAHHLDTFAIMGRIVLPALRIAHIEPLPQYTAELADTFSVSWSGLMRRSHAPPLEELHVFAMAPMDIVWTLERAPRLKQLHLAYCTNPAPVLKALAAPYAYKGRGKPDGQARWLSPKLRRFCFKECFSVSWRGVARVIQNRHRAYLDGRKVGLMVDLVVNGHDVLEDRDLNAMAHFKLRQIATLIEP